MNVLNAVFAAAIEVADAVLSLYVWVLIAGAVMSWLVAFNVVNGHNRFIQMAGDFYNRITDPLLRPIRRVLPPMGGLDLSPLVLIFIIMFLQSFLRHLSF